MVSSYNLSPHGSKRRQWSTLECLNRQMHALTANIQDLARQSAADRREMQELTRQNQEIIALLCSKGEIWISNPGQGQNGGERPHNEEGGN